MSKPNLARLGKVDVRKDEEQNAKLSQCIKLLIDAGYFRARVKGLPPFDKIVGGMTWCIEVCAFDVDVELLYKDTLTIGQKIALTERIVKVLPLMKCPHQIEPHQIQGLDAIHIFPVIEWLVRRAVATRREYGGESRLIAIDDYGRYFDANDFNDSGQVDTERRISTPTPEENAALSKRRRLIHFIKMRYGPKRRFRATEDMLAMGEDAASKRPLITLAHFQHRTTTTAKAQKVAEDSDAESMDEEDEQLSQVISEKMAPDDYTNVPRGRSISNLVDATTHKMQNQAKLSLRNQELLLAMESKLRETERSCSLAQTSLAEMGESETDLRMQLSRLSEARERLSKEKKEIVATVDRDDAERYLDILCELYSSLENTKQSIGEFKQNCQHQAKYLEKEIEITETTLMNCSLNETNKKSPSVICEELHRRVRDARRRLGVTARRGALLERRLDDVPGRAELAQYHRRFTELYALVAAEQHQTQQFYSRFNSLSDERSFLEKELTMLNSVLDNIELGLSSPSKMEEFIRQLKGMLDIVAETKNKLESKRRHAELSRNALSSELRRCHDLSLSYAKALQAVALEMSSAEQ